MVLVAYDMLRMWITALIFAVASIIVAYWAYGLIAFIFPSIFVLLFFVFFGVAVFGTLIQAESIPGLEKLGEPNFFFSRIYMAWLYVNDRERWAEYTVLYSYLADALASSLLGILSYFDFSKTFVSWLLGMFITLLIAIRIAKSKRWTQTRSTRQL